ncbi:hypothetical protein BDW22DRAFT_1355836 [Trametopsis cervina]|nr:hypothetical protein BDW22DRAFT_1355836 [Trametopsis cervina]
MPAKAQHEPISSGLLPCELIILTSKAMCCGRRRHSAVRNHNPMSHCGNHSNGAVIQLSLYIVLVATLCRCFVSPVFADPLMSHYNPPSKAELPPLHCRHYAQALEHVPILELEGTTQGIGEALWTPFSPKGDVRYVGYVGYLEQGTFVPWFCAYTPNKNKKTSLAGGSDSYREPIWSSTDTLPASSSKLSATASLAHSKPKVGTYEARLDMPKGGELVTLAHQEKNQDVVRWMCAQWERWTHTVKVSKPAHWASDVIFVTGYCKAVEGHNSVRAVTTVADPSPEYLRQSFSSVGQSIFSVRYYKALRRADKPHQRMPKEYRSIIDEILWYILKTNEDVDVAVAGHDDIDRFLQQAPLYVKTEPQIGITTTYYDLVSKLGKEFRPPVHILDYQYAMTTMKWPKVKGKIGVLPYVHADAYDPKAPGVKVVPPASPINATSSMSSTPAPSDAPPNPKETPTEPHPARL